MRRLLVGALLWMTWSPVRALAAEGEAPPVVLLGSIQRLYEAFEYEQALLTIQNARPSLQDADTEVRLWLYEGILLCELGRFKPAANAFKSALLMRPDSQLPTQVAPKIEALFVEQRLAVQRELAPAARLEPAPIAKASIPLPPGIVQSSLSGPGPSLERALTSLPTVEAMSRTSDVPAQRASLRDRAGLPLSAGLVSLAAGGVCWVQSQKYLTRLRADSPELVTWKDVRQNSSLGQNLQLTAVSLLGLGAAAFLTGVGMHVWGGPDTSLSLAVDSQGTSAFVQGRWP